MYVLWRYVGEFLHRFEKINQNPFKKFKNNMEMEQNYIICNQNVKETHVHMQHSWRNEYELININNSTNLYMKYIIYTPTYIHRDTHI